ncbi:UNVERIFIED_CONTAM: ATP synthase delta chain, chloroplastic [Sesamum angustifolium]|uniref:ATP synthase delta chain, chloroplastic n=1 Tax=Sesamum angustifolium TaxID=2727405 RepID=A0AAW2IQ63_9LAMI
MKRIDLIKEIVKEYEVVYNKITDTQVAVVTSVVQLESQHLAQIAKEVQRLTSARNIRIKTVIDPSLVAGFTIRYGNSGSKLIDMSVKKQLEEIAAELDLGDIQLTV